MSNYEVYSFDIYPPYLWRVLFLVWPARNAFGRIWSSSQCVIDTIVIVAGPSICTAGGCSTVLFGES